jgi:hypothetical protein
MKIQDSQETLKLTSKVPPVGETWWVKCSLMSLYKSTIVSVTDNVIGLKHYNTASGNSWAGHYKVCDVEFVEKIEEPESKLYSI